MESKKTNEEIIKEIENLIFSNFKDEKIISQFNSLISNLKSNLGIKVQVKETRPILVANSTLQVISLNAIQNTGASSLAGILDEQLQHYRNKVPSVVKVQKVIRRRLLRNKFRTIVMEYLLSDASLEGRTRIKILKEIFETEVTFRMGIGYIQDYFEDPLKKSNLLPNDTVSIMFSNLDGIIEGSKKLINQMLKRSYINEMGKIFVELSPIFIIYTQYISNYPTALALFNEVSKKPECQQFFQSAKERFRKETKSKLDIVDLLILPVQRLPRYVLLLTELLKRTPTEHLDYPSIQDAIQKN